MNKTVIVTGANTGIGKATACGLAEQDCHVIMACRNEKKGIAARNEIIDKTNNKHLDLLILDLSSQQSIMDFVSRVQNQYSGVDVLINNAGVSLQERKETNQGLEWTFAVNHLGPFLLTVLLLDLLKKSAPSRVVTVSSGIHPQARLDFNDLNIKKNWNGYLAYANSKLCNIYFTYKLAEQLKGTGVTANCLGPGLVNSDLFRHAGKLPLFFKIIKKIIGKTPEQGAETSVYLALSQEVEGISGKYYSNCKQKKTSPDSYNKQKAEKLWDISRELCGL